MKVSVLQSGVFDLVRNGFGIVTVELHTPNNTI